MSERIPENSEIVAFVKVVDEGSVSGAAQTLNLPRATISRRLSRLEERLGVRLLHRTTRQINLTQSGEDYYNRAREVLKAVEAASAAVSQHSGVPRGQLRVSIGPACKQEVRDVILSFLESYPEVELELIVSTALEDLRARKIDVALRTSEHLAPDLVARKLFRAALTAVASPSYIEQRGMPNGPDDLAAHTCLLGCDGGEKPATHWPLRNGGNVRVHGRLVVNDMPLLRDAALRGLGIALLPAPFGIPSIKTGALVEVLADEVGSESHVALVYPDRHLFKPAARAFVDHIVANASVFGQAEGVVPMLPNY